VSSFKLVEYLLLLLAQRFHIFLQSCYILLKRLLVFPLLSGSKRGEGGSYEEN